MSENKNPANPSKTLEHLVPWLPESFWQENFTTIGQIFDQLTLHYPDIAVHRLTSGDAHQPTESTRKWMWQKFMGGQHGYQRGAEGKVYIPQADEPIFMPAIARMHYGPYGFMDEHISGKGSYDKAFVLGGTPTENTNRMMAATNHLPLEADIDQIIMMAGQRPRWNVAGEKDVPTIYQTIQKYSGADIDKLRELSPFVKEQEARNGEAWERPYPSEFELARLTVEAIFMGQIDWNDYYVDKIYDEDANPLPYEDAVTHKRKVFPARRLAMVTYTLKDGRKIHVTNSPAQPRPMGEPKPTSDTTVREAIGRVGIGEDGQKESIVIGTSAPHVRAGLDALIRLLQLRGEAIKLVDLNSGTYEYGEKELIAAFGEIPATYKADQRLHAVVKGDNPDSEELTNL